MNIVKKILLVQKIKKAKLSIAFVTQQKITALNKKFLKRPFATDVLAFDFSYQNQAHKVISKRVQTLNGEIVISLDAALKNAKIYDSSFTKEIVLYVIHGILHLSGFDDHRSADKKRMREKEKGLLKKVEKEIKKL